MAAQIGSLYVSLTMNSQPFAAGISRAQQVTSRASSAIRKDIGLSQRSVDSLLSTAGNRSFRPGALLAVSRGFDNATDRAALFRSSLLSLTAVAGGFSAAIGSNLLARYADTFVNLSNQIRTVTDSSENLATIQTALSQVADRSRSGLQATTTLYARTARATEHLGTTQKDLLRITETVQKAFSIGGATSAEAQGAAIQLSQGIASDRFSGEEFRSVAENAPVLLRGMAESLDVTIGQLREMAHAGELTAAVVTKAILESTGRIEKEFGETAVSLDRALGIVDNRLITFVGTADKAYGVSQLLANGIIAFGDNLDTIVPVLTKVAALIGTVFLARNKAALGGGIGALVGGGAGFALGGLEGALLGAGGLGAAGAFSNMGKKGLLTQIKDDAAAAKERVDQLRDANRDLKAEVSSAKAGLDTAKGNLIGQSSDKYASLAPKSALNEVKRDVAAITEIEQKRLAVAQNINDTYAEMGAVTSQMSPRAAKLAQTQAKAYDELNTRVIARKKVEAELAGIIGRETDAMARQSMEGRKLAILPEIAKERAAAEERLAAAQDKVQKQTAVVAERNIRISQLASAADKKAVEERITLTKRFNGYVQEAADLNEQAAHKVAAAERSRSAAVLAGSEVARQSIQDATRNFNAQNDALRLNETQLRSAARSASFFGQSLSLAGRGAGALIGALGGPAGIAITAIIGTIGYFAAEAQKARQSTAQLKDELQDLGILAEDAGTGVDGLGKSLEELADDELRNKLRTISGELDRIRGEQNIFQKLFQYDKDSLGNLLQELEDATMTRYSRSGQATTNMRGADLDTAKKLMEITKAAQAGQISTDVLNSKLEILAAANPNASGYIDDWISRLRAVAPFMDALVERQEQLNAQLNSQDIDTSFYDDMIAQQTAVEEQLASIMNMRAAVAQMSTDAGMSEEEARLKSTTDDVLEAWQAINDEKGISIPLSRSLAEEEAKSIIAIEDAEKARRTAADATAKQTAELVGLMAEVANIQSQISAGKDKPIDESAAAEVSKLVDDLRTGKRSAEDVIDRLQIIAETDVSSGMKSFIDRIIEAVPLVSALVNLYSKLPGAGGGTPMTSSDRTRQAGGDAARAKAITDAYEAELTRRSQLTTRAQEIEDRAKELMENVPGGGKPMDLAGATALATKLVDYEAAVKLGESKAGGSDDKSAFDKSVASLKERAAALQVETNVIGMNTYAQEKARAVLELQTAAREDDLGLTPARIAAIEKEASAYAAAAASQEETMKKQKEAAEQLAFYKDTFSSFLGELRKGLMEGADFWTVFADAAANALDRIAERALSMAADGIFDMIFGAIMGGIGGGSSLGNDIGKGVSGAFSGGSLKFAAGGQVRGPGSARSDSIMARLSNGEFVVNAAATRKNLALLEAVNDNKPMRLADGGHVQGGAAAFNPAPISSAAGSVKNGQAASLVYAPKIDNRGADAAAVARLEQTLQRQAMEFESRTVMALRKAKKRGVKI